MEEKTLKEIEAKMEKTLASLKTDLNKVRTGRASLSLFDDIRIDPDADLEVGREKVTAGGRLMEFEDKPWPYPETADQPESGRDVEIPLTPYHEWATRGPSTMRVWIPAATKEPG